MGALSFSPSPITIRPFISTVWRTIRIALTAAWSAASLSPRPIKRPAAKAAASVTRANSSARLREGSLLDSMGPPLSNEDLNYKVADRRAPNPRVDAIQKTAVTGENIARILESALALEHAFTKIPQWGNRANEKAKVCPLHGVDQAI